MINIYNQLGKGGQAEVFRCSLTTLRDSTLDCVDKCLKITNNERMTIRHFKQMYKEFRIGCCLRNPGIVEYKYFIRRDSPSMGQREQELHIIIELCEGGNLEQYLNEMPLKREVNI
jgi:serine/threonine protein kinase